MVLDLWFDVLARRVALCQLCAEREHRAGGHQARRPAAQPSKITPSRSKGYTNAQMQPCRYAFVAACAAVAAANNSLELVRDVALEDVPAGPRELHQRYSEIFRYGNRNAAFAPCVEIKSARWRRG